MDVRRKANREDHEITLQYKTRREAMLVDELNEDRLTQLLAFIDRLQQTPPGSAELRHRTKLFGECKPRRGRNDDRLLRQAAALAGQGSAAGEIASPASAASRRKLKQRSGRYCRGAKACHRAPSQ